MKVLDFGLAKAVGDTGATQLTVAGTTTGTPGYMAPEIALAEGAIDRRADIYALGCVAYFLLTGTTVFEEENPTRVALLHVQTGAGPAVHADQPRDPAGAGAPGHAVPGEAARRPAADDGRGCRAAGELRRRAVDTGRCARLVGSARHRPIQSSQFRVQQSSQRRTGLQFRSSF